jgi:glyoxylase-like metal-dependent hydrolase (beta-lactamase superfamily II)
MFHYKRFVVNPVEENCYIIWDDNSHEGAVIDCGAWSKDEHRQIASFIREHGITLKYALQTHMNFDHCLGLGQIASCYGLTPMCHPADVPVYEGAPDMVQKWFRVDISDMLPEVDPCISESYALNLGDNAIQVLHTPGHTPGGVCYYIPQARIVITGDTLFRMGIGRTDLPGGDYRQELESIENKIFTLPADTKVLPGHGPESSVGEEMNANPYIP